MAKGHAAIESAVVDMYCHHPSPSHRDKLEFADRRMGIRLHCCGIEPGDYERKRVLDAGCGTGEYSAWFASRGAEVTGIDLSDGSLAEAREYASRSGLGTVRFEKRSVLDTGLPDASFDLVYCTGVLHHTPDPIGGFKELVRLVRHGGKILVSLYNSVAFVPREMRRSLVRWLAGDDLDARVRLARRLFPRTARRLTRGDRIDHDSALYDYFAIPHESMHSIGEVLRWFERTGLDYCGAFPPARVEDYPAMFRAPAYAAVERKYRSRIGDWLAQRFGRRGMARRKPDLVSQATVQTLWLLTGVIMFCICGKRR